MNGLELVMAGLALGVAVTIGLVIHEMLHALILRLAGIEYEVVFAPGNSSGLLAGVTACPWAAVSPQPTGTEPAWHLRCAALAPFVLAIPTLWAATSGLTHPVAIAFTLGLLACAIPSPQDFSVAFYAHRLLEGSDDNDRQRRYSRRK